MIKIHLLILFFPLQMQVMSSAKQHRKYDSIKSIERNKYDSCAHHWRFYFKELPKNKVLQVKNSYDNFWNILFICYLLLLFDFTRPLGPHLSISHWAPILVGTPLEKRSSQTEYHRRFNINRRWWGITTGSRAVGRSGRGNRRWCCLSPPVRVTNHWWWLENASLPVCNTDRQW
jgi:hypothetical protein